MRIDGCWMEKDFLLSGAPTEFGDSSFGSNCNWKRVSD
jgi:hypothetical protein